MKKILAFSAVIVVIAITATVFLTPSNAISSSCTSVSPAGTSIPDSVNNIIEKSCYPCHSSPGNGMAMMHLDFDKWDTYNADKQASKAKDMSKMVTKGKMPTGSFKKNNPDKVPTAKEVSIISNWAASLVKK